MLQIDFLSADYLRHIEKAESFALKKVFGLKKYPNPPSIFDATAGLLKDSLTLGALGCNIIACEKEEEVYTALDEAKRDIEERQETDVKAKIVFDILKNIELINEDSNIFLKTTNKQFDIIYLDPMFANKGKAKAKKNMQFLRDKVSQTQAEELFLTCAKYAKKVVVKRHLKEDEITNQHTPNAKHRGNTVRFDVYKFA